MRLEEAKFLLLTLLIFVAGSLLTATTIGLRLTLALVTAFEPRLEIVLRDGRLISGIDLERVAWHDSGLHVEARNVQGHWLAACLLKRRLCIRRLDIADIEIKQLPRGEGLR